MAPPESVTSTDYRNPHRAVPIRLYNAAGRLLGAVGAAGPIAVPALLAAARKETGLSDFGDPTFREPLEVLVDSMEREARLNPLGRMIMRGRLQAMLANRLRVQALCQGEAGREIEAQAVQRPIVIAGLQRTGTTMLHRLLAADPAARSLRSWEALNPAPLGDEGRHGTDRRRRQARLAERGLKLLAPDFFAIHPVEADAPDEDVLILDHAFTTQAPEATLHVPTYAAWLERQDVTPSYRFLERCLRLLLWQRPGDFWVLKTPHHMEFLGELLGVFPDAVIVQTHRDPQATIGSFCSMVAHGRGIFSDHVDAREVGRHWLRKVRRMVDRSLAVREGATGAFIDVSYYDLLADPLAEVRRIYAHAGRTLTPAAEAAMREVLERDKQHRYGRHVYRTRDFGLSPAAIDEAFADYRARFAIRREKAESESTGPEMRGDRALGFQNPLTATVTGIVDLMTTRGLLERVPDDVRLDGKTAIVTGATSGLGNAVAIDLVRRGARVIIPARSGIPEAGREIARRAGGGVVEMLPVDLSDLDSVAAFADELAGRRETVDLLVCNAGVMPARGAQNRQGFELMFGVHYLANHLLSRRLLASGVIPNDVYAHNGRRGTAIPRIVMVVSETHRSPKGLDFERFGAPVPYGVTDGVAWYGYSKLAATTYASELARRLTVGGAPSVGVHALCPGPVDSNLAREAPAFMKPILGPVFKAFFRSPAAAAGPVIYLGVAPELAGDTGWYMHLMRRKQAAPAARDEDNGRTLWAKGEAALAPWLPATKAAPTTAEAGRS